MLLQIMNSMKKLILIAGALLFFSCEVREQFDLQGADNNISGYDLAGLRRIIYSYAEDSSGNGKADRIRVQTNLALNGDFSRFEVEAEGYNVRRAEPFKLVSDVINPNNPDPQDTFSFYIYLEEGQMLYDGQPIKWRVIRNDNSLMDSESRTLLVGDPALRETYLTINTIPPRVSYAVTLPGHNETFIQMSEPVYGSGQITGNRIAIPQSHRNSSLGTVPTPSFLHALEYWTIDRRPEQHNLKNEFVPSGGVMNYRLKLDTAAGVFNLAQLPEIGTEPLEYFVLNGLTDMAVRALDWNDPEIDPDNYMYYPSPRYPVDWNYSGYKTYIGNSHVQGGTPDAEEGSEPNQNPDASEIFMPPNRVLTPEMVRRLERGETVTPDQFESDSNRHRITDILVSRLPANTDDSGYFAWPVWARYKDTSTFGYPSPGGDFWGQQETDDGIIWEFDGTKFLQERDIILQARVNNNLNTGNLNLYFGFNVPAEWRNPQEATGLWLPDIITSRPSNLRYGVPGLYPDFRQSPAPVHAGQLWTFDVLRGDGYFKSGGKLDFLFKLDGIAGADEFFIVRLDAPQGSDLNSIQWWTMLRPWSFYIQNIRLQSGGVTVINNVINPDNRELAYIRYHIVRAGRVTIQVYTQNGTVVKSIRHEHRNAGEWTDVWDGTDNGGRTVARGVYYVRVAGPDINEIRQIMVVK